jgi:hypothetical protein
MEDLSARKKAIARLMGDMDGLEGKGMFEGGEVKDKDDDMNTPNHIDINISILPKAAPEAIAHEAAEEVSEEAEENKEPESDNAGLPPFLRKALKKGK